MLRSDLLVRKEEGETFFWLETDGVSTLTIIITRKDFFLNCYINKREVRVLYLQYVCGGDLGNLEMPGCQLSNFCSQ